MKPIDTLEEHDIEMLLLKNPNEIVPDAVGARGQIVTGSRKRLDLLVWSKSGTQYVVEIKRGRVQRKAIDQVIEYCTELQSQNHTVNYVPMIVAPVIPETVKKTAEDKGVQWKEIGYKRLSELLQRPIGKDADVRTSDTKKRTPAAEPYVITQSRHPFIDGKSLNFRPNPNIFACLEKFSDIWMSVVGTTPEHKSGWIFGYGAALVLIFIDQTSTYVDSFQLYLQHCCEKWGIDRDKVKEWQQQLLLNIAACTVIKNDGLAASSVENVKLRNIQMDNCLDEREWRFLESFLKEVVQSIK